MSEAIIPKSHPHFETHHQGKGKEIICMQNGGKCSILVEVDGNEEEQALFTATTGKALSLLDNFFGGKFAGTFRGLHIKIGDGLVNGGAEAKSAENRIVADKQKMQTSLKDEEQLLAKYFDPGDRTRVMSEKEAAQPASAWVYELIHEVGHLLDEQTAGPARKRVAASESPTKYGREPDDWHATKEHEAFAEGFTHMVFGAPVSPAMRKAVEKTLVIRLAQTEQNDSKNWGEL